MKPEWTESQLLALADKMPAMSMDWSEELRAAWLRCAAALMDAAPSPVFSEEDLKRAGMVFEQAMIDSGCRARAVRTSTLPKRLLKIIDPIVRGQIKSFRHSHPNALRGDLSPSIAKRIINDLTCEMTVARLTAALWSTTEVGSIAGVGTNAATRGDCTCIGRDGANLSRPTAPPDNPESEDADPS